MAVGLLVGLGITTAVLGEQVMSRNAMKSAEAYYAAEAGIEDSIYRVIKGKAYEAINSLGVGDSSTQISISTGGDTKTIEANGSSLNRNKKLEVVLKLDTTGAAFHYGAQVGDGGLRLLNNAVINGSVYSNGDVIGETNSQVSGDVWVASLIDSSPDQQWLTQNSDFLFGRKDGSIYYIDAAQSFIPSKSGSLVRVSAYLKKVGSPADQTVRLVVDSNGQPASVALSSGTLIASKVTANYSWVDVNFDTSPNLVAGQKYWLVIDTSRNDNNYWVWGKDNTDGYAANTAKYSKDWADEDEDWFNASGDLSFKIWFGGGVNFIDQLTMGGDAHANTIKNSQIDHDAYYQNIDNTTVGGNSYANADDPAPRDLAISYAQIQAWEQAAEAGGVINGNYAPTDGTILGPLKIDGNLTISGNKTIILRGPVWVVGDILAENDSVIRLDSDAVFGFPLIADKLSDQVNHGRITLSNNVDTYDGQTGAYLLLISTNKSHDFDNPAIRLDNNVNADAARSIIFSLWGVIGVSNNAKFKEISGYGLRLDNNAQIVYEQGLADAYFSSGPSAGWQVNSYKEIP